MRKICTAIALLLLSGFGSLATAAEPVCVMARDAMPESWRPSPKMQQSLSDAPWSAKEAEDVKYAIKTGVDEMVAHFAKRPKAVTDLWDDAVESLIDLTYSGGTGMPEVDAAAREGARRNLEILITPYLDRDPKSVPCDEFQKLLPLAIYAHRFFPAGDARAAKIVALTNAAHRRCASLAEAMADLDYAGMLANRRLPTEDVFNMVIWSIQLIEAEAIPGLELSAEAREFSPKLWRYLESYPLVGARAYRDGAWNETFKATGYLATHIAYIPTGYHRYPLYVEDSPSVYRFHRENFYPLLEMGELDLLAEFVDTLRQYGCTEENDLQVRDGTRYMLKVFHDGKDRWMNYREPGEEEKDLSDYDLIHKPWSATIGIRPRVPEPVAPGTYGGVVRRWLPPPR